jgi:hypothetical protein
MNSCTNHTQAAQPEHVLSSATRLFSTHTSQHDSTKKITLSSGLCNFPLQGTQLDNPLSPCNNSENHEDHEL